MKKFFLTFLMLLSLAVSSYAGIRGRDLKTEWYARATSGIQAIGGVMTNYTENGTNYTAHVFTTNGTFTVLKPGNLNVLVVAGGGGAGGAIKFDYAGAGGGAGGLVISNLSVGLGAFSVTVGAGGTGGTTNGTTGVNGSNSLFSTITAIGGGAGGGSRRQGNTGGSGGGAGGFSSAYGAGTTNQGYRGGGGSSLFAYGGGGGGGAGGIGATAVANDPAIIAQGGASVTNTYVGVATAYASGGLGGYYSRGTDPFNGVSGTANTGNGGSAGRYTQLVGSTGGTGGSGIVIIRYPTAHNTDLLFTSTGYGTNIHWTAPFIVGSTLTDNNVTWYAPNGLSTNSKTPSTVFFATSGTYRIHCADWSRVTQLSFYAGGDTITRNYLIGIPNANIISPRMTKVSTMDSMFCQQTAYREAEKWNISNWTNVSSLFLTWFENLSTQFPEVKNKSKLTNVSYAWSRCYNMTDAPDISSNTNINDLRVAWAGNNKMTNASPVNTLTKVDSLNSTWYNCSAMVLAPEVSNLTKVEGSVGLYRTWYNCQAMTNTPDVSGMTKNLTLYQTWYACYRLTSSPDVSRMTNNASLFQTWNECRAMTNTPDVSRMTKPTDLNSAWNSCYAMQTAPVISQMVNVVAAGLRYTWYTCRAMTNAPI